MLKLGNSEQIEALRLGRESIISWQKNHRKARLDLSSASLPGINIDGPIELSSEPKGCPNPKGLDLKGSNLMNTKLTGANLTDVDLRYSSLEKARRR